MNIQSSYDAGSHTLRIVVKGRLDFKVRQEFRDAYERGDISPRRVMIDLGETEFMDSSGLGMLLLVRDYFKAEVSMIHLLNPSSELGKILAIANFDKLFTIQ